ncbi:MAG: hypothetical protein PHU23_02155 [Dehalococcoidales bacterium]|nr:hypothetical protein [Dehalococcoidales bacterium]
MPGMQGLGKPSVHQCRLTYQSMPRAVGIPPSVEKVMRAHQITGNCLTKQVIPKALVHLSCVHVEYIMEEI